MANPETPLDIVVRFSTSHPDVILRIDNPSRITNLSFKQLLRAQLESPASTSRLRLIHSGKVLPDTASLSKSLAIPLPPPQRSPENASPKSAKAKGKLPIRDPAGPPTPITRIYIHCSIGDTLTPSDLRAETISASQADSALLSPKPTTTTSSSSTTNPNGPSTPSSSSSPHQSSSNNPSSSPSTTTLPTPRGFDRLLSAGFTAPEVAALRTQFLAIQAHTHTPDDMPSGGELLALEERWLDNTSGPAGNSTGGGGEETGGGDFGSEDAGALEDMLYGNLMGFFWPIGAMGWLMREEGVWSRRRQIAVLSGFLVNLVFGFLRVMN